jgi:hypothetical protein
MVGYNPEEYKLSTRDYASVGAICGFKPQNILDFLQYIRFSRVIYLGT